ncbi:MAG: OsmC family peroxiredoxin [Microbacteriaceae bacterium]
MLSIKHTSSATWSGTVPKGTGQFTVGKSALELDFSLKSRLGEDPSTNPEELIAAALCGCYAMSLSGELESNATVATGVRAQATVHLVPGEGGFSIPIVDLSVVAEVPGLDDARFQAIAEQAERVCPVAQLLKAEVRLTATLGQL